MAGTIGDVIQLTLQATYLDQTVLNVFYYRLDDTPTEGYLEGLATEFQSVVLDEMSDAQVTEMVYDSIRCLNIFSGDEYLTADLSPNQGVVDTGNAVLPSFQAAGYKLVRSNARVRNGYKFLAGLDAGWVSGNNLAAGYIALAVDIEDAFAAVLNPGGVDSFTPVIVGRVEYTTSGGNQAYRLPLTQVEMGNKWAVITEAQLNVNVTTERSRKEGHGV